MTDPTKVDILAAIRDLDFNPPQRDKRPCDELDESTIAEIDADVTESCRQKFLDMVEQRDRALAEAKYSKFESWLIAVVCVGLLIALGKSIR